jgi:hypothetical protein
MDKVFQEKLPELREILELKKKDKMEYVPILGQKEESVLSTFKLTIEPEGDKKTKFYIDGKEVEYNSIDDLRKYISLGSELKNPNIIVSKLCYMRAKSCLSVKLKLKSCTLIPSTTSSKKNDSKFNDEGPKEDYREVNEELC